MSAPITREEFATKAGRRRAWRALMLSDHGLLRKFYSNTHEISPGKMWRSYQPSPRDIAAWRERGIRTIINLRGDKPSGFYFLEEEACRKHGIELVTFRVFSREAPTAETLQRARALFDEITYPAMMHCKSGADRAGLMSVLYLFFHENVPLDQALAQLSFQYGHVKRAKTGILDETFNAYLTHARKTQLSLGDIDAFFDWADNQYDPVTLKANFTPDKLRDFFVDTLFRRE